VLNVILNDGKEIELKAYFRFSGFVIWRLPWSWPQEWNGSPCLESRMVFQNRWEANLPFKCWLV